MKVILEYRDAPDKERRINCLIEIICKNIPNLEADDTEEYHSNDELKSCT